MQNYLVATLGVGFAFAANIILNSFSGTSLSLWLLCSAAILFAAWVGGVRVGIYALSISFVLCLAYLLNYDPGVWRLGLDHVLQLIVFLFQGLLISTLCGDLRNTNARSQRYQQELELALNDVENSRKAAEEANLAQHEFLANTSHELRTPINAIMGMTQLSLKDDELSPMIRDNLETVTESASSLLRLLNDLLDYSKIEAGRFDLRPRRFSMHDTLEAAVRAHSANASSKGLELACMVAPGIPPELIGDPDRLGQIASNLVGNAVKFTAQGEVFMRAELMEETSNQVTVKVLVRDSGIGIPYDQQQNVFTAFKQVDASNTRQKGGVGLGLAIVQEVSAQMGGGAGVISEPGKGSTFYFTATFRKPKRPRETKKKAQNLLAMLRGLKVLVVDDNSTSRKVVAQMLTNWSMRPVPVNGAEAALAKLENDDEIQLVLIDALMPKTDGFDLVEEFDNGQKDAPVLLMLSAADRATFAERVKKLNLAGCIEKPISQSDLLDGIVHALRGATEEAVDPVVPVEPVTFNQRVLLVEDTPANQKVVVRVLDQRGHTVVVATNGREAVEMAAQGDFDCILMDIQMPTMDGFQATSAIRALDDHERSNTPIIAMTAHAMTGDREKCLAAGMDGYLAKPIDIDELIEIAESFGGGSAVRHAVAGAAERMLPAPPEALLWNEAAAMKRLQNDRDLLHDLIGYFLEDAPVLLQQLRDAVATNDLREAERFAHSIKGLAQSFAADTAAGNAADLEQQLHNGNLEDIDARLDTVEDNISALAAQLQQAVKPSEA